MKEAKIKQKIFNKLSETLYFIYICIFFLIKQIKHTEILKENT